MHIWLDLLTREAVFLAVLAALGAGPAAFLSSRMHGATRLALAPALGLCLGVALTITLVGFLPVRHTWWAVIVVAVVSLGIGVWRTVRVRGTFALPLRELLQIALVVIVVLGVPDSAMHSRHTVGPVALNVYDAAGYVPEIDSQQTRSVHQASQLKPVYTDLEQESWASYAHGFQNLDVSALEGSVNDLLGLDSTDTQSAFMVVILLVGALGAFAALRYATDSRSWAAALAGVLFGGSFFLQLWADSSQAALCGLALVLPFMVVGAEVLRERRLRDCVLLGLVSAGLLTVYPLFVPCMVIGSVIVLAFLGIRGRRARPSRSAVLGAGLRLGIVVVLAAGLTPVAFARALRYWNSILHGGVPFTGLPVYHLSFPVVPGWLLQTRQFYYLSAIGRGGAKEFLFAIIVPLLMLGVIAAGLLHRRLARGLLAFAGACTVLALYVALHNHCSYCTQRNLLPVGPMAAVALALGVAALFARGGRPWRIAGVIAALIVVVFVGIRVRAERTLVVETAYMLDSSNRAVLAHLPAGDPTVEVEGYGANLRGPGEMPLVYDLVNERTHGHASIAIDSVDYSSFAYLGPPQQPQALKPSYSYVLSRFAGLHAGRQVIARSGGIALERRAGLLDVTPTSGLGSPFLARLDPGGDAWAQGGALPDGLGFDIVGARPGRPVWLHLGFATAEAVDVPRQRGVTWRRGPSQLSVCVAVPGRSWVRHVAIGLSFTPLVGPPLHQTYSLPNPAEGVELTSMTASPRRCVP